MNIFKMPWWISALLGVCSYILLRYVAPNFLAPNLANFAPTLAPIIAMGFFLHSGAMLYEGDVKTEDNYQDTSQPDDK